MKTVLYALTLTPLFLTACTTHSNTSNDTGLSAPPKANQTPITTQLTPNSTPLVANQKTSNNETNNTPQIQNNKLQNPKSENLQTKTNKTADHGLTENFDTLTLDPEQQSSPPSTDWQWDLPPYFPIPRVPKDNPMSKAKVELGRHLFYDPRLSVNGTTSCATCHLQELAFTDGKAQAIGATGEVHPRSSLSLANVAYLPTLNWANPAITQLEAQLLTPMFGELPIEMGLTDATFANIQAEFAQDKTYQKLFTDAFGNSNRPNSKKFSSPADYSLVEISQAIASFERSILSTDSKFDRHIQGKAKLTASEQRGKTLFFGEKAECHHCHGSLTFNDQIIHSKSRSVPIRFHNTGMYNLDKNGSYIENNEGLFEVTANLEDKGKFRAPSLRNIAITAPYNHDGSTKTLEEVVANYAKGGRIIHSPTNTQQKSAIINNSQSHIGDGRFNPNKSDLIVRIDLNEQEQADIVDFLRTLTDESLLTNPNYANPWTNRTDAQ